MKKILHCLGKKIVAITNHCGSLHYKNKFLATMIHIILNRILLFTTANTPMRIGAITCLLISMATPVVANWNGGWNFHGVQGEFQQCFDVMPTTNNAPKFVDVGGHINTELGNAGQALAAKGEIAGIQLDISLHKFYGDYKYSIFKPNDPLSGQRLDVSISSFVDTDGKVSNNILRCRITNHFYIYRITTRGNPVTYESYIDVGKTFVIEGFLAKINTESIPDYFPDGNYFVQGEQYSDLYDGGFFQRLGTIEFNKLTNSSNSYSILNLTKDGTQYTGGPLGLTLKNPIIFTDQGGFIKAVDPIFVTPSSTKNGGIRIYNIAPSRMVALEFMYSLPNYYYKLDYNENVWASFYENGGSSDFSCRIAPLDKIKVPVSVHDVTRLGTISTKPIATNVFFYKPNGQLVASGRSNVGGTITLDEGDVDMNETYNITLELASTDPKWPWSHRRHYANLIPAQIQPRQLALPVTLQTALREQLVRLAPLRAGAGYDLTGVWRLLTDWNPWQVQPLPLTEIRKRDESLARLHIALQQLADIYIKADELSVSMAKAVINSATAWQEMVEARQKIRTTVATSRISHSRLDRKLYGKLLEYMEDNIRNWVIEQIQGSLTGRQADLFGKMLDAAISARRAYFNSNDIKNRTSEVNEAARANLISGLASDAIAKLALQEYVETTQKALDSAVVDTTDHQWTGSTGDGIIRAVPLGAFLVEQIEQPLNDADFLNNTSAGWNEIAEGLGSVSIGRLFFKITAGIRIITTTAQTAAVVRLFVVHDDLDNEKVSKVIRSAYHDIGATADQLLLSADQSDESTPLARVPYDTRPKVFTGFASALTTFEQSLPQDVAALKAKAEIYLAADDTLDLEVQVQINRLCAMDGQAAEPRRGLAIAIGTMISKARELRDARMDLALAMVDGSESSALGSDASDTAILAAIGNVRSSLNSLEQALAAARNEATGLSVPAVLGVERAWVPTEREDGTVIPGAVEIRARICNRGDAPSAVASVVLASSESYPGLHSIQAPAKNLPVLAPGQSIEVSWTAGLGELGADNRGLITGYSIRIGAGDSLISEFDGQIQGGTPQGTLGYAIDGIDDGFEGYLNRTVQTWPTRWSSYNALTNIRSSQNGDRLNLLIGGCASGNSMLLFIDSRAGGVNRITPGLVSGPDAAVIDNLALDGGTGLTFEQGFAADHVIRVGGIPEAVVHIANLQAPGLISAIGSSGTAPISGGFVAKIATKWNPVILDPSRFSRCERGIEISLDLMALGLQPGANRIKLFALLVNDFSTLGSNQSLPSRGVDTDIGSAVNTVNFANESGNQMLAIDVTIENEPLDTDADGLPDAVETGTGHFVDPSDTGTDPAVADTDGDGYLDGDEVSGISCGRQSNPNVRDYSGMVVAGSFNLPEPWNPIIYGNSPDTTMTRNTTGSLPDFYRWTLGYQFNSTGWIEYKFAAGSWASNWGSGTSLDETKYGNSPNLRARIEATGIHRFHFDQAAGSQSFERVSFADAATFLRAYGLAAGSDADQDGLLNEVEFINNTDPTRSDSDNDGTDDAFDPLPLQTTRDVVFIADLWLQKSLGHFNYSDGRVFVRFTGAGFNGRQDLELTPTGEHGIYRGVLTQTRGEPGENLGNYHLVYINGLSTTPINESISVSRSLTLGIANQTQRLSKIYFNNEIPPDGTGSSFFGEESFDDDNLGPIGSNQRWRYNIGGPSALLTNRNQRLSFTSNSSGTAFAGWATPSTSNSAFDKPWSATVNVTNTTTPTAGYTIAGLETQLATNVSTGAAISAYYGIYLYSDSTGKRLISEFGLLNPTTLEWTRSAQEFQINGLSSGRVQLSWSPQTNTLTTSASADGINFNILQTYKLDGAHAPPGSPLYRGMGLTLVGSSSNPTGSLVTEGEIFFDALRVVPGPTVSNVSTLSNLAMSAGSLSPTFASTSTAYSASVANNVTTISLTPTLTDPTASVKVNGVSVTSGSSSTAIPLTVGANQVTVLVTAQDGTTTRTYTVSVTRAASAENSYQSWIAGFNAIGQSPADDSDNDGVSNLLEYVLSGDPTKTSSQILPTVTKSGSSLVFRFNRLAESSADVRQTFQYSNNLATWQDLPLDGTSDSRISLGPVDSKGLQSVTITIPLASNNQMFGRLKVELKSAENSYQSWIAGFNAIGQSPADDSDNDGVSNLLEYVLSGDPTKTSSQILPTVTKSGSNLVFRFNRLAASSADVRQTFQYSNNLATWQDLPLDGTSDSRISLGTVDSKGLQSVTITIPLASNNQMFGRLKIELK